MRYLDKYVRIAAENFENELARVAQYDKEAKKLHESPSLKKILKKIGTGEIAPPSGALDGFDLYFTTDAKFDSDSWAANLCYKYGEKELFSAYAALSYTLRNFHNDLEFANDCHLTGYSFPDGWPDNPVLYRKTVQDVRQDSKEKAQRQGQMGKFERFKHWLSK